MQDSLKKFREEAQKLEESERMDGLRRLGGPTISKDFTDSHHNCIFSSTSES